MAALYHLLSYDAYKRICNVIHSLDDVLTTINDNFDSTNMVWSSQKIVEELTNLETVMQQEIDTDITNKATIEIGACPTDADMEQNKLYFEPLVNDVGETYYDCYTSLNDIGKIFLGSSIFEKEKYLTKEEMDKRYGAVDIIDRDAEGAPISSKGFFRVMVQEIPALNDMFLSTHDNLPIPNISQEGLTLGTIFPIGDGFILETYRNGFAYWSIKFVRSDTALEELLPSAIGEDTLISEILPSKDDFGMACAAWPELRDANKNEEWIIPLQSKLLYLDESPITYSASLVIKNTPDETIDSSKISLYFRASEEIPVGTILYGSTCFTINHTR